MKETEINSIKQSFDKNGFAFIPGFLDIKEMEELKNKMETFIQNVVPSMPPEHAFYEDKNDPATLKQMQNLESYDTYFNNLIRGSKFERLAEAVLNDKVVARNVEYFNKPPLIGKATPPHQDAYYFKIKPPEAVTMWLALEEVDKENGCVHYVKGSHKSGMRPHGKTETLGFSQGITDFGTDDDIANEIAFPAKPGDLLIHHAMTIHRAGANKSKTRSRRAVGLIYFAESSKENVEAKSLYQESLLDELRKQKIV